MCLLTLHRFSNFIYFCTFLLKHNSKNVHGPVVYKNFTAINALFLLLKSSESSVIKVH